MLITRPKPDQIERELRGSRLSTHGGREVQSIDQVKPRDCHVISIARRGRGPLKDSITGIKIYAFGDESFALGFLSAVTPIDLNQSFFGFKPHLIIQPGKDLTFIFTHQAALETPLRHLHNAYFGIRNSKLGGGAAATAAFVDELANAGKRKWAVEALKYSLLQHAWRFKERYGSPDAFEDFLPVVQKLKDNLPNQYRKMADILEANLVPWNQKLKETNEMIKWNIDPPERDFSKVAQKLKELCKSVAEKPKDIHEIEEKVIAELKKVGLFS